MRGSAIRARNSASFCAWAFRCMHMWSICLRQYPATVCLKFTPSPSCLNATGLPHLTSWIKSNNNLFPHLFPDWWLLEVDDDLGFAARVLLRWRPCPACVECPSVTGRIGQRFVWPCHTWPPGSVAVYTASIRHRLSPNHCPSSHNKSPNQIHYVRQSQPIEMLERRTFNQSDLLCSTNRLILITLIYLQWHYELTFDDKN